MTFTDSAGNVTIVPDTCVYCEMTTGGHDTNCPLHVSRYGFDSSQYVCCPKCGCLTPFGMEHTECPMKFVYGVDWAVQASSA